MNNRIIRGYIFCIFIFLNMMSFDVVLVSYIPAAITKFIILSGLLATSNLRSNSKRNMDIFKVVLIYGILNIVVGVIILPENLTSENFSSIFSLVVTGYVFTHHNYTRETKNLIIKVLIYAPIGVLILGLVYQLVLNRSIFRFEGGGIYRLQGASVPAHYGMICFFGIFAQNISFFIFNKKGIINKIIFLLLFVILYLTGARTALLCSIILTAFYFSKYLKYPTWKKVLASIIWMGTSILYLIIDNTRNNVTGDNNELINTSGRTEAWAFFYRRFLDEPVWGIGSGNSSKFMKNSIIEFFITPHNEYLRLIVETGLVGACIIIILVVPKLYKNISLNKLKGKNTDFTIAILYLTVLIFSITDNTFATYQFYIPFLLIINYVDFFEQKKSLIRKNNVQKDYTYIT